MQARLVAVVVRAVDAGEGVGGLAAAEDALAGLGEDAVQPLVEHVLAQPGDERIRVLRDEEGVLHGIAFLETAPGLQRVEVVDERAAGNPGTDQLEAVVEDLGPAVGQVHQLPVVLLVPELPGELGRRIGAEAVLERMGHGEGGAAAVGDETRIVHVRDIPVADELLHVHLAGALDPAFPLEVVLAGGRIHLVDVEVPDAAVVGACEGDAHHVGAHARDVLAAGDAVAEPAGVLVHEQLAGDPVGIILGIGQGPQLREVPVTAPDGVRVVMVVQRLAVGAEGNLPHAPVVAGIGAVHVARQAAAQQGVIQARVELDAARLGPAGNLQPAERFLPQAERLLPGAVEVQPGGLGLEVGPRIVDGGVGKADLDDDLVPFLRVIVQAQHGAGTQDRSLRGALPAHMEGGNAVRDAGKLPVEEHLHGGAGLVLLDILRFRDDIPLDDVAVQFGESVADGAALPFPGAHVHQDVVVTGLSEREALEAHARRGRQLRPDAVVLQEDGIVARTGRLVGLVEAGAPAGGGLLQAAGNGQRLAGDRHEGQSAHLELMEARESVDGGMGILVADGLPALVVPVGAVRGRAQLGHAERNGGRGVHEPAAVDRADVGVHIRGIIFAGAAGCQAQQGGQRGGQSLHHFFSPL